MFECVCQLKQTTLKCSTEYKIEGLRERQRERECDRETGRKKDRERQTETRSRKYH